ncbi:DNA-binding protein (plasmid) [Paraburkholderia sp. FT54]|uniref:DNA-binding protein n=1 Tax=Paraburkholderia sp. FT54 TaxID=3074437 RepID=UPI002877E158|nr:DNA-binding protein [Paraburkholderia sp. FT54]WNC95477.1 DNA-binding protein [Paraburkholderia sp. FT54]
MALKTLEDVRAEFDRCGLSVSSWAAKHGIHRNIVSGVLQGRLKGKRGHAHNAAVLLGLKDGVVNREDAHEPDLREVLPAREGQVRE